MNERSTPTIAPSQKATPIATTKPDSPSPAQRTCGDQPSRHAQIATEAYLLAEQRGFTPGQELEDWLAAEKLVEGRVGELATQQLDG